MQDVIEHLIWLLDGGHAHIGFEQATADLPAEMRGRKPPGMPHTPWRLLEHMRIAQWDILEFSRNASHVSPDFPEGYWPTDDAPASEAAWDECISKFHDDLDAFKTLITDPAQDLIKPFPWGDGQTLLREALLIADHNAYHLGQLIAVRQALGAW